MASDNILIAAIFGLLIVGYTCYKAYIMGIKIQEAAKSERSQQAALERTNKAKVEGLFEIQLQKMAATGEDGEGSELMKLLEMYGKMRTPAGSSEGSKVPPGASISWDVMKQQLESPEVKKTLLEHKDEALAILMK